MYFENFNIGVVRLDKALVNTERTMLFANLAGRSFI